MVKPSFKTDNSGVELTIYRHQINQRFQFNKSISLITDLRFHVGIKFPDPIKQELPVPAKDYRIYMLHPVVPKDWLKQSGVILLNLIMH